MQQAIFQAGTTDLDEIGEMEAAFESARGDTAVKGFGILVRLLIALLASHLELVAMSLDLDLVLRETGYGHGDSVGVIASPLDVVRRIGLGTFRLSQRIKNGKEPIETDS